MTANPIIGKELITVMRSRAALALAIVFTAVLAAVALFMWPATGVTAVGDGSKAGLYSRLFFNTLLCSQLLLLALFSPPFAATSVVGERERNTWETLYYTGLGSFRILVGKLVGAVVFLLILVVLSLPAGSACLLLGGVSLKEMFTAYLILIMAGFVFGLIGLAFSAFMRSSFASLIGSYAALLVLCGATFMPLLLLPRWEAGQDTLRAIRSLSPFSAIVSLSEPRPGPALTRFFVFSIVVCVVLAVLVLIRITKRPARKSMKHERVIDAETPISVRLLRRIFFIIDPKRRRGSIPAWTNPIFFLELRTRTAGLGNLARATFACLVLGLLIVLAVLGEGGTSSPDLMRLIALSFSLGLIILIGPSLTAGAFASEVEANAFDQLRMTQLRPWTFFWGKFGASVIFSLMLVVASLPVFLAVQVVQAVDQPNVLAALAADVRALVAMFAVTAVTIIFALSSGLFFSSLCRTTARATAWAYGLVSFVTIGSLFGLVVRERLSDSLAHVILAFNPIITVVGCVAEDRFREYGDWSRTVLALGALSVVLIVATIIRLHRIVGPTKE